MRSAIVFGGLVALLVAPAFGADAPEVYKKKCELCHSIGGAGGAKKDMGGALDGVGAKRDATWMKAFLKDPKSQMPQAKMPKMPLTDAELDSLVAYMGSLK